MVPDHLICVREDSKSVEKGRGRVLEGRRCFWWESIFKIFIKLHNELKSTGFIYFRDPTRYIVSECHSENSLLNLYFRQTIKSSELAIKTSWKVLSCGSIFENKMELKEKISIDEIDGKRFKIRFVEAEENRKAVLTHYLHNINNGVSDNCKNNFQKGFPF